MWQLKGGHVHFIRDFFLSPGYGYEAIIECLLWVRRGKVD